MLKHTPGPWQVKKVGVYEAANHGICIAMKHPLSGDEWKANRRLIAAAPELLAALEAFVVPWSAGGKWEMKITYETYNAARAAIDKAKGESNEQ